MPRRVIGKRVKKSVCPRGKDGSEYVSKSVTEADIIFNILWDMFLTAVEQPVELDASSEQEAIEDLVHTIGAEIEYLIYFTTGQKIDLQVADWFATYLVKGEIPDDREFDNLFFEKVEEECKDDDMESYYECITKAYGYARGVKMFFKIFMPSILKVEMVG